MYKTYISRVCALVFVALSPTPASSSTLSLREKRAACSVAIYHLFHRRSFYRPAADAVRMYGKQPHPIFLEAYDARNREVTPAALITALRREGCIVQPTWLKKKWLQRHDPQQRLYGTGIRLTRFRTVRPGVIGWEVRDWQMMPRNARYEGGYTQSQIELMKVRGKWHVVKWKVDFAAG